MASTAGSQRTGQVWPHGAAPVPPRSPSAPPPGTELQSHYRRCYGCGPDAVGGLHLRIVAGEGLTVEGVLEVTPDHQGAPGLAHGGLLATAMDEVLGSLNWLLAAPAVTASLQVDFQRPVPVGTELHVAAGIAGAAGRRVYSQGTGRIGGPDGPVAITARAVFVRVGLEHFTVHGRPDEVAEAARQRRPWTGERMEINP